MSQQAYKARSSEPFEVTHNATVLGASGAASFVVPTGRGMTLTYGGSGLLTFTWKENPGVYIGQQYSFSATTMSALKGYTVVFGAYNTTTFAIQATVYNSTFTATDLAALQWLAVKFVFSETGSNV